MSVMAVTKRTIELPTGGLVGVVRGEGQFTNAMPSRDQVRLRSNFGRLIRQSRRFVSTY